VGILKETAELAKISAMIGLARIFSLFEKQHSEKLGYSDFEVRSRDPVPRTSKVMIVAHPDDESLFGGETLTSSKGWLVVCVTNASNEVRRAEFIKAMGLAGADYLMLDHADHIANGNFDPALASKLALILAANPLEMVVTHGEAGEYGHKQHIALHQIVRRLAPAGRLFTFGTRWLARPRMSVAKERLLECYGSQDIAGARYMAEREVLLPIR
jgi:LmbE family N-acetylglucosaminyl deacetylase